jgi:chromosome segregation ATPase
MEITMAVKAGTTKNKGTTETTVKTRKTLTHAERVEKMRAELAALEAKAQEKTAKQVTVIDERIASLTERRDKLTDQIAVLIDERAALVGTAEVEAPATDQD